MVGLDRLVPILRRKNSVRVNHRIYCSKISKAFILNKYPMLDERHVRDISEKEGAIDVTIFDKSKGDMYKLKVTPIDARHCPGSVM